MSTHFDAQFREIVYGIASFGGFVTRSAKPDDLPKLKKLRDTIAAKLEADILDAYHMLGQYEAGDYEGVICDATGYGFALENAAQRLTALSDYGQSVCLAIDELEELEARTAARDAKPAKKG